MNTSLLQCPSCRAWLLDGVFNRPDPAPCPSCGAGLKIDVFPAFFRPTAAGQTGEAVLVEGESSCFYHPEKKAVQPCHGCGRFLCALCDCELSGQHFCPTCLEAGRTKGKIRNLDHQRTLYDNIALALAVIPPLTLFGAYFTFITAPIAIFVALRHWKAPLSIVRRWRIRQVIALILALLQIAGWILFIYYIVFENA